MDKPGLDWPKFKHPTGGYCEADYDDLTGVFGKVLVRVEQDDYQGDTWLLLVGDDCRFGYLTYSWGSCCVCDGLEACETDTEREALHLEMWDSIAWNADLAKLLPIIRAEYETESEWMRGDEFKSFIGQCEKLLDAATDAEVDDG